MNVDNLVQLGFSTSTVLESPEDISDCMRSNNARISIVFQMRNSGATLQREIYYAVRLNGVVYYKLLFATSTVRLNTTFVEDGAEYDIDKLMELDDKYIVCYKTGGGKLTKLSIGINENEVKQACPEISDKILI